LQNVRSDLRDHKMAPAMNAVPLPTGGQNMKRRWTAELALPDHAGANAVHLPRPFFSGERRM
jgi:hypothetical protein